MTMTQNELVFAKNLDDKLKNLHEDDSKTATIFIKNNIVHSKNIKNLKNSKINLERPKFITTVKKGTFLDPPGEIALLLGLQRSLGSTPLEQSSGSSTGSAIKKTLYSYSSKPRVQKASHAECIRRKRSSELNNAGRDGNAPYKNIMYDRRVVRGTTCNVQNMHPKWDPYFAYARLLSRDQPKSSSEDLTEKHREARRRALARKKARGLSALSRGRHLTPPPAPGRRHEPVQTEQYLEAILDPPPESDAACQTDLFLEPVTAPVFYPAPQGANKATQVYPGELVDLEEILGPIVKNLVDCTMERSLLEVLEEEQMAELRAQQRCLRELEAARRDQDLVISPRAVGLRQGFSSTTGLYYLVIDASEVAAILMDVLTEFQEAGRLACNLQLPPPGLLKELLEELEKMTRSYSVIRGIVEELLRARGLLQSIYELPAGEAEGEEIMHAVLYPEAEEKLIPEVEEMEGEAEAEQPSHSYEQFFGGK